jgi:flagellar biosynthesis/type III secretory pathway ATPase
MALWIDSNNQVHDDMDGAALALPSWPQGMSPHTMPAPTAAELLAAAQQTQLALIDSAYDMAMQQPVAYMNTAFQADVTSQDLMNRAITGLQSIVATGGAVPANFAWYDINNQPVAMTLLQLQGLFATGVAAVNTLFVHKQTQKAAIRAATTNADVTAITF